MAKAIVFVNTMPGTSDLMRDLEKVEGVREEHSCLGLYDAVAMVQVDSLGR